MKNLGRNFIIAFLMVLAIYQTGELWFGDYSDHNFFSLLDNNQSSYSKNTPYILERLIINLGDNRVVCRGSNIYGSDYKEKFDSAIETALSKGTISENTGDVDWKAVLDNRAIIYQYSCSFKGKELEDIFSIKNDNCSRISSYDTIIISPRADNSFMRVIFYDSAQKTSATAQLKSSSIIGKCFETSSEFLNAEDEIYYISSVENGFNIFSGNEFLPQSEKEIYEYNAIEPHLPLNDVTSIEKNANIFFDNAATKNYTKNNDNFVFSDETSVVKFYENSVLEYFNYDTKKGENDSFSANYAAAVNIIMQDKFVTNEFYLKDYSFNEGQYVFKFNYKINNMLLLPGENVREKTGMESFIEITASDAGVDKYKKYACRYTTSDKVKLNAKIDFIGAVDKIYAESYGGAAKPVNSINLAYMADTKGFGLKWIINIENKEYIAETEG